MISEVSQDIIGSEDPDMLSEHLCTHVVLVRNTVSYGILQYRPYTV